MILLIIALIVITTFTTAFAIINYANTVKVWPWMNSHPLTYVIAISFFLGAGVGSLLVSLVHQKRFGLPASKPPVTHGPDSKDRKLAN